METVRCPRCRGRAVGRVGVAQWYCWDCCVEFARGAGGVEVFDLDEEGELTRSEAVASLATAPGAGPTKGELPCAGSAAAS